MPKKKMYQRSDGLYEKKITIDGVRVAFRARTEREVMQKVVAYSAKKESGPVFNEMAEEWWKQKEGKISPNTVNGYRVAKRRAVERFENTPVKDINTTQVRAWLDFLARRGYARKTVCNHLLVITAIFAWACENHGANENPALLVHVPDGLSKNKRTMPTDSEIKVIQKGADTSDGRFFYFLLYTGLRVGEALALQWKDVDKESKQIHVYRSVYFAGRNDSNFKAPKTESGVRDVIYLDRLQKVMEPHRGQPQQYVFGGDKPMTKKMYTTILSRFRKENHVTCTPHQLRHAFATLCFEADIPEKTAQGLLGHAQLSTTMDIYAELRDKKRMEAAEALNNTDL